MHYYLNYFEHLLILVSTVTGCVSISTFASLVRVSVGITITSRIKKYKPTIKKKKEEA